MNKLKEAASIKAIEIIRSFLASSDEEGKLSDNEIIEQYSDEWSIAMDMAIFGANYISTQQAERDFQSRVLDWLLQCFGAEISKDILERNDRFIEESLELAQSLGYTADRAHALVDYVFNRPKGEPFQEVGGVMVTLAALCSATGLDMIQDGEIEYARINKPEIIEKIRKKQASKPTGSALPQ